MDNDVSHMEPGWSREQSRGFRDPSRKLLRAIRRYQALEKAKITGKLVSKYWVLEYRFWSAVTGAEIDLNCQIGGGLLIPHPKGIVIHPDSIIGVNCLIFQQVTLAAGKGGYQS